jgi:hypothetical protein
MPPTFCLIGANADSWRQFVCFCILSSISRPKRTLSETTDPDEWPDDLPRPISHERNEKVENDPKTIDDHDVYLVGKCDHCGEQIECPISASDLEMMGSAPTIAGLCPECEAAEDEARKEPDDISI